MKLILVFTLLVGISLSNAFSFSRDFNLQIPGLTNGPNFGGSVNANAGQQDAISNAINQTFSNIRQSSEQFIQQSLLQISKPLRDMLGISDDAVKSFFSNLSNIQNAFSSFQPPQLPGLPKLGEVPQLGQLPKFGGLPQLGDVFKAPQLPQGLPGLPQGLPQIPGLSEISKIADLFNPNNLKNILPNFDLLNGKLSNNAIQQALSTFSSASKSGGDVAKQILSQLGATFNSSTAAYKSSINTAADSAKSDIQKSLSSLSSSVRSCVDKNGNPGTKAIDTARQSAFKCVDDKVQQARDIVNKTRRDIDTGVAGVQNFTQSLSQCQLNVSLTMTNLPVVSASQTSCLASSLLNVQAEAFITPFNLAARGFETYTFFQTLQGYAVQCVGKLFAQVATETAKTSLAISKCTVDQNSNKQG